MSLFISTILVAYYKQNPQDPPLLILRVSLSSSHARLVRTGYCGLGVSDVARDWVLLNRIAYHHNEQYY